MFKTYKENIRVFKNKFKKIFIKRKFKNKFDDNKFVKVNTAVWSLLKTYSHRYYDFLDDLLINLFIELPEDEKEELLEYIINNLIDLKKI